MGAYKYKAKRTEVDGVIYASKYESRFAKLLIKQGIKFIPHCWCVVEINNEQRWREIDFFCFPRPIKPIFCDQFYFGFELKAVLQMSDYTRRKALKESGVPTFIVLPEMLNFWEKLEATTGTFLSHKLMAIKRKRAVSNGDDLVV